MRVLVVEDSKTIRLILSRYLELMHLEVIEAADGREALLLLSQTPPLDLALVDWNMPELNGIDFIRELRQNPAYRDLPVIMVTTNSESEHAGTAIDAGANDYIEKPCTLDMLREKLDLLGLLKT